MTSTIKRSVTTALLAGVLGLAAVGATTPSFAAARVGGGGGMHGGFGGGGMHGGFGGGGGFRGGANLGAGAAHNFATSNSFGAQNNGAFNNGGWRHGHGWGYGGWGYGGYAGYPYYGYDGDYGYNQYCTPYWLNRNPNLCYNGS